MKAKLCTVTLILVTLASLDRNIDPSFWGHSPWTVWNFLLSVGYLAAWGWFLCEMHGKKALWFYRVWWTISLIGAAVCICPPELDIMAFVVWPLGGFFLTELSGLSILFPEGHISIDLFYTAICGVMLWLGIRKMKKLHYR